MTNGNEEFRKFADECEKMAKEMTGQREMLLELAKAWRRAAAEEERRQKKSSG